MKRTVYLGIGDGGLWLSLIGEEIPAKATVLDAKQAKFWLRQAVPPMAHPTVLHAISEIAEGVGYPFHGAMAFADLPWVLDALERALHEKRLIAYRSVSLEGGGKGPTPPTPPPPPPPPPPPTPVNPRIEPASLVVLVKKIAKNPATKADEAYTNPKRQPVKLATDAAFDGTATFTCDKADKVKFFSAATGGVEIKFDGTANVFKPGAPPPWAPGASISSGVTVYAEGAAASAAMDDVTIKLELKGGSKPTGAPDTSTITSVEVTLDLHKARPSPGAAPPALSKDDKVFVGRNLLVQNSTHSFQRAQLVIQKVKPDKFTGTLVLKAKSGAVDAFADEDPKKAGQASALPFEIAADKIPAGGHKLFAEGKSASKDMRDSGFVLGVKGVEDEGDRVAVTAVEIRLDVCQSRTVAQATAKPLQDPSPMKDEDKVKVGRFVQQQDQGGHQGRALLVVRKVKPEKFDGVLVLDGVTPKTEIFEREFVTNGESKTAVPHEFDYKSVKNEDKRLWVQGKTVSGALRDGGYLLHLKEDPKSNSDEVKFTVVKFSNLKIEIPATPANTERTIAGVAHANRPASHTRTVAGNKGDDFEFEDVLNPALVLIEDSILDQANKRIHVSVQVAPANVPVLWDTPRDVRAKPDGDHPDIAKLSGKPKITAVAGKPLEAELLADAVGTFHIAAFVDCNGSGTFDPTADVEPYLMSNLVLVRVQGKTNNSVKGGSARVVPAAPTAATGIFVSSGGATMATAAAASIATMTLTGGGDDGRRGLDRVFAGWGQHILASGTSQSAPAGLDIFARFQHNPPAPPAGPGKPPNPAPPPVFHREFFIFTATRRNSSLFGPPPAAAPVVEACPLLDVSPGVVQAAGLIPVNNVDGKGGDSCTGQHGSHGPLTPLQKGGATPTIVDLALGQDWTVDTFDSPGSNNPVVQANHFGGLPGQMIEFRYNIDFRVDLLVWTNQAGVSTATADPSNRLYSTVQTNTWNVRFQISFNPPLPAGSPAYAGPPAGAPGQPVGGVVPPVTLTMNKDASPTRRAKAVDGTNLETRFPSALSLFSVDARS